MKRILLCIGVLLAIATSFSSCVVAYPAHGYGYRPGPRYHRHYSYREYHRPPRVHGHQGRTYGPRR